jgi:hypothetical protein
VRQGLGACSTRRRFWRSFQSVRRPYGEWSNAANSRHRSSRRPTKNSGSKMKSSHGKTRSINTVAVVASVRSGELLRSPRAGLGFRERGLRVNSGRFAATARQWRMDGRRSRDGIPASQRRATTMTDSDFKPTGPVDHSIHIASLRWAKAAHYDDIAAQAEVEALPHVHPVCQKRSSTSSSV